ncbi:MAG: putative enoyl-CoA hydratase [Jatrophihabitantaceae bacterium]|nr:putative enoyl-CoA hydratase [Jatrophihabitantaceae bacterium]
MTAPDAPVLLVTVADAVATVTLNRPAARNALNLELRAALSAAMRELDRRDDVAVVVLTGSDPAFCAGMDLRELSSTPGILSSAPPADDAPTPTQRGMLPSIGKPVIGAVNGVAVTGGLELALACDFLIASDRAKFGDTHARVGLVPGGGLTVLLPQAIGLRRAREMSFTGNFVDAAQALEWGLVNRVVPHEDLMRTAQSVAADIAGNHAGAVARVRATYAEVEDVASGGGWAKERAAFASWVGGISVTDQVSGRTGETMARGRTQ